MLPLTQAIYDGMREAQWERPNQKGIYHLAKEAAETVRYRFIVIDREDLRRGWLCGVKAGVDEDCRRFMEDEEAE